MTNLSNNQMEKNSKQYNKYKNDISHPDKLIEWFVKYYGEEKRSEIETLVKSSEVVFLPKEVLSHEVLMTVNKIYKDRNVFDKHATAKMIIQCLTHVATNKFKNYDIELLTNYSQVLKELDIDLDKILLKDETKGCFSIQQNKEFEQLKNRVKYSINSSSINREINVVDFIFIYRNASKTEDYIYKGIKANYSPDSGLFYFFENNKTDANIENFTSIAPMNELDESDMIFLKDFLDMEQGISVFKKDYSQYIVKGINKIFNKKHLTMQDVVNDESLHFLLTLRSNISADINKIIAANNVTKFNFISSEDEEKFFERSSVLMINNPNLSAWYDERKKVLVFPISSDLTMGTVAHEYNHALAHNINNHRTGFADDSVGFNEIVNEFLTQKIILADESKEFNPYDIETIYNNGIEFMQEFLVAFESKLKLCQFGNAPEILGKFIGEKNYKTLMEIGNRLESLNYGQFALAIYTPNGVESLNISDWLTEYDKDPLLLYNTHIKDKMPQIIEFLNMREFLTKLTNHLKDFEMGKIEDIEFDFKDADVINRINIESKFKTEVEVF